MGRSPLTLAALSTNAIDGLMVVGARTHTWGGDGDFDSAVVSTADGRELIFRVPTTRSSETAATEELPALSALSAGIRSRLSFEVPVLVGHAVVGPTIGRLFEFVPGGPLTNREMKGSRDLCVSVGSAIASIHNLPRAVIDDFGLPRDSAASVAAEVAVVVDRARSTGRLPEAVAARWDEALGSDSLWDFTPTVVHGDLSETSFAVLGGEVTGVFGWSKFHIGDPAADLAWFIDLPGIAYEITEAYLAAREGAFDDTVRERALLHRELDLARWMLHGVDTGDASIVDDGARMLRALDSDVERGAVAPLVPRTFEEPTEQSLFDSDSSNSDSTGPVADINDGAVDDTAIETDFDDDGVETVPIGDLPTGPRDDDDDIVATVAMSEDTPDDSGTPGDSFDESAPDQPR